MNKLGKYWVKLARHIDILKRIKTVLDIGCGDGGLLYAFYKKRKNVTGINQDAKNLEFGIKQGLNLIAEDLSESKVCEQKYDLVILSHVLEHLENPFETLVQLNQKVHQSKYLLLAVPGIYNAIPHHKFPLHYLNFTHIYNYYLDYMKLLLNEFGFKCIYGTESCNMYFQKYKEVYTAPFTTFYKSDLNQFAKQVFSHIKNIWAQKAI